MTKPRVTTAEQDRELAAWYAQLRAMGTVQQKARELGISVCAVYDAIARGSKTPTRNQKHKLASYLREMSEKLREPMVPRESPHNESIESVEPEKAA